MHKRNLLVLAALFSVAPLSAQELPASYDQHSGHECPFEQAIREAEAAQGRQTVVTIEAAVPEGSLLGVAPAYLP